MIWLGGALAAIVVLGLVGLLVFRVGWVNNVENYQLGYTFDSRTGETKVLDHTGYVVSAPIVVKVYKIDLRPMQVCISANARTLNCKLVKFNPAGLEQFLAWHGNGNYEGPGTGSTGGGNLDDILESYAYDGSGKSYPFLTVLREMKTEDSTPSPADDSVPK